MRMVLDVVSLLCVFAGCITCAADDPQPLAGGLRSYDAEPAAHVVTPMIQEGSGIADSQNNPGNLWVMEDSGNPTQLYLLGYDGKVKKKVFLKGTTNRDWEEMRRAGSDLYIGEIGDNRQQYNEYLFYQFTEPTPTTDTVSTIKSIRFRYEDGAHDAEAFLVEPGSKDIFIITKRDSVAGIYKLAAPYSYTAHNTAKKVGELPYNGVVAAALSPDGKEILVKTYPSIYRYTRSQGQSIDQSLQNMPDQLGYQLEPQGEAITYATSNTGFFTLSEKGFSSLVNLYFYKRK